MQTTSRFFDDLARVMTGAAGAAQGVRREFEGVMRSQAERMVGELELVTREEFDAMRALAIAGVERAEALEARLAALEEELAALKSATIKKPKTAAKKKTETPTG
jgi:BMFP domain-containing protein YqiC